MHAGLFAGFAVLWMYALRGPLRRRAGCVLAAGLLFAALTEAGQHLLPFGRTASLLDAAADAAGLLIGLCLFWGSRRFWSGRRAPPRHAAPGDPRFCESVRSS